VAFGGFDDRGASTRPMAEINMIPLIDVMLVLLVIFIITAPLLTHAVRIDLPKASSAPNLTRADHVQLAIDADGGIHWNGEPVDRAALRERLAAAAAQAPQPEIHLRADRTTQYQAIAEVLADSAAAGATRLGFVSVPEATPGR
jgi:biopolymer transport protein ExbD